MKDRKDIIYPERSVFEKVIFPLIEKDIKYPVDEQIPSYETEPKAVEQLLGTIQLSSEAYYPSLEEKAAYIFTSIAKGHFFINGNKRLAVVTVLLFFWDNDCRAHMLQIEAEKTCLDLINTIFPEVVDIDKILEESRDLNMLQQFLYLISFIAVESERYGYDFNILKSKVKQFFQDFFYCHTE